MLPRMRLRSFFLLIAGCLTAAACADTSTPHATFSSNLGGGSGEGGSGAGDPSSSSSSQSASSSSSTGASSSSSSSTSTSSSSSSGSGGSGGEGGSGGGGPACDYSAPNTCLAPTELEQIAGDGGSDVRTVNGTTSKWFKVLVHDPVNVGNSNESYTATLKSPPGMDFDLYEYTGDSTGINCLGNAVHAMGDPEFVSGSWSDGFGNDDKWISLEVRYISGQGCGAEAKWTLTVEGNTNP